MEDPADAARATDVRLGSTWFRVHADGRYLTDLRWLGHQYRMMVFALPERQVLAEECCTEEPRLARLRADRLMQTIHPHDCTAEACAPWIAYSDA